MNADRRTAYLRAMGLEVWVSKTGVGAAAGEPVPAVADFIEAGNDPGPFTAASTCFVEPGHGDTLLICGSKAESVTAVARDIARSLRSEPVWGWPVADGTGNALSLEQAIRDRLITRLVLFGIEPGPAGNSDMTSIGTAETLKVASLPELARSGKARKAFWGALTERRWSADRARPAAAARATGEG